MRKYVFVIVRFLRRGALQCVRYLDAIEAIGLSNHCVQAFKVTSWINDVTHHELQRRPPPPHLHTQNQQHCQSHPLL